MGKLTENIVYNRTKTSVESVRRLNLWGCDIDDLGVCNQMLNLEVLSVSVNRITTIEPLVSCKNLQELYLRRNEIEDLDELKYIKDLPKLKTLWLEENPCCNVPHYRSKVLKVLPNLQSLDNKSVTKDEVAMAITMTDSSPPGLSHTQSVYDADYSMESSDYEPIGARFSQSCTQIHEYDVTPDAMVPDSTPVAEVAFYNPVAPPSILSTSQIFQYPSDLDTIGHGHGQNDMSQSWPDFSVEDGAPMVTFQTPPGYDSRRSSTVGPPVWGNPKLKSLTFQRRRFSRSRSCSPSRRMENIMSAIWLLLDEVDQNGLRMVIDECQKRIKKQR